MKRLILVSILSFANYAQSQDLNWVFDLPGDGAGSIKVMDLDVAGNIYVAGQFIATMDADPSEEEFILTGEANTDIFVAAYSSSGQLYWAVSVGGSGIETVGDIKWCDEGIVVCGNFSDTVDFDPGTGLANKISNGLDDVFILNLLPDGDFNWVKTFGGVDGDQSTGMALDVENNIITCGLIKSPVDFNPTGTPLILSNTGLASGFFHKMDWLGNLVWVNLVTSIYPAGAFRSNYGKDLKTDSNGDIYAVGWFTGETDFNPGPDEYILPGTIYGYGYAMKWSAAGEFIWAAEFGGDWNSNAECLDFDPDGNLCIAGIFNGYGDFDPGPDTFNLGIDTENNTFDMFVLKLTSDGAFIWAKEVWAADAVVAANDIDASAHGHIHICGNFGFGQSEAVDFDPGPDLFPMTSQGNVDAYLLTLCDNGDFISAGSMGGVSSDVFSAVREFDGHTILGGWYNGTADVDPGSGIFTLVSAAGNSEACILNLNIQQSCCEPLECPGDFNGNNIIGVSDVAEFIGAYGCTNHCCPYDLNFDGAVSVADLVIFISVFGDICE